MNTSLSESSNPMSDPQTAPVTAEDVIKELLYAHHHCLSLMECQYDKATEMAEEYMARTYLSDHADHNHLAVECPWRKP